MTDHTGETPRTEEMPLPASSQTGPSHWYLDMLGVRPAEAGKGNGVRNQTAEVTFSLTDPAASTSTPTPLEHPAGPAAKPTPIDGETPDLPDMEGWAPRELAKQVESSRNFRWSLVITLLALTVAAVTAILWAPTHVEGKAAVEAVDYAAALRAMQATLPDAQQALAIATEPNSTGGNLIALDSDLTRVRAAAVEVIARADRPLPDTPRFFPRDSLESLEPTRSRMTVLGETSTGIVNDISEAILYRTTLDRILTFPGLPVRADAQQAGGLAASLAAALTDSAAVLSDLPLGAAFDTHRLQAAAAVESFGDWQNIYLESLRSGDTARAADLISELQQLRRELFDAMVPALAAIRSEIDTNIIILNEDVNHAVSAIPL